MVVETPGMYIYIYHYIPLLPETQDNPRASRRQNRHMFSLQAVCVSRYLLLPVQFNLIGSISVNLPFQPFFLCISRRWTAFFSILFLVWLVCLRCFSPVRLILQDPFSPLISCDWMSWVVLVGLLFGIIWEEFQLHVWFPWSGGHVQDWSFCFVIRMDAEFRRWLAPTHPPIHPPTHLSTHPPHPPTYPPIHPPTYPPIHPPTQTRHSSPATGTVWRVCRLSGPPPARTPWRARPRKWTSWLPSGPYELCVRTL